MDNEEKFFKELEEKLSSIVADANSRPIAELDNLSPNDAHHLLYDTFGEESSVGFKAHIPEAVLLQIPFLNLFRAYLKELEKVNELKLTTRGNLPKKLSIYLYDLGFLKEEFIEAGIMKMNKEGDSMALQNMKIIGLLSGITKKRNNKISLTKKGKQLVENNDFSSILKEIFITNIVQFNLGYHDGYPEQTQIQQTFGYTLYLLLRYGKVKRSLSFYSKKCLLAFPFLLDDFGYDRRSNKDEFIDCYALRIYERFLMYYGLVDFKIKRDYLNPPKCELKTTDIFDQVFELRKDKFMFEKSVFKA